MERIVPKAQTLPETRPMIGVPKILIIGVGSAGNNGVSRMSRMGLKGAKTIAINTEMSALMRTDADTKILIGKNITGGKGSGGDTNVARKCLEVSRPALEKVLEGSHLVFIVGGMGGGTATGVAGEIAKMAQDANAMVIGLVTTPFKIERDRADKAWNGVEDLSKHVHSLLVLDNNRLLTLVGSKPLDAAFLLIDQFIAEIIKGMIEVITEPSLMNVDFNDVKSILSQGGWSSLLYGEASDIDPLMVVEKALKNPITDIDITGATGALIHITCSKEMSIRSVQDIAKGITENMDEKANIILGARVDPNMRGKVRVMSIVTGIDEGNLAGSNEEQPQEKQEQWDKWDIPSVY